MDNKIKDIKEKKESRKKMIGKGLMALAGALVASPLLAKAEPEKPTRPKQKLGMLIDLHKCTGCGACEVACIIENNVPVGITWASHHIETKGKFPNVQYTHYPTLCNHCEDAPCVNKCPTRAMYKNEQNGLTLHDPDKCIGCTACGVACPYGAISFNKDLPHARYRTDKELIEGCTGSGEELSKKTGGQVIPYYNKERAKTYPGIRPKGVVEKCTLCDHRLAENKVPYCQEACPTGARTVVDFADPQGLGNIVLKTKRTTALKEHLGTKPKVHYLNSYNSSGNKN